MPRGSRSNAPENNGRSAPWLRGIRARLALAICSGLVALVVVEIGYRTVVAITTDDPQVERFNGSSDYICTFDREFGYSYIPGKNVRTVRVDNGRVWEAWRSKVNSQGNIGDPSIGEGWQAARNRILIVGDSFTANPNFGGVAWPDALYEQLIGHDADVAIHNFGRDGYGILQMVHMAKAKAESLDPSLIIVACITDDLTRDRFWRTQFKDSEFQRVFTTTEPVETPEVGIRADATLINNSVERLKIGDDAEALVRQFDALGAEAQQRRQGLWWSPAYSFLFHRILHGDPLAGCDTPAQNPRHVLSDFRHDDGFLADTAALNAMGVSIAIVHLPTYFEIVAGRPFFEKKDLLLVKSLRDSLPQALYVELLSEIIPPEDGLLSGYHRPLDVHPSGQGARMYGNAVGRVLLEKQLLLVRSEDD